MTKQFVYGDISIIRSYVTICNENGWLSYDMKNITGLQVCFSCSIKYVDQKSDIKDDATKEIVENIRWMPMELFMGKREGDKVEINIKNIHLIVTCTQQNMYEKTKFEEILHMTTQSFGGVTSPSSYEPPLCERSQCAMILANHEKYSRSLKIPTSDLDMFKFIECYFEQSKKDIKNYEKRIF